MRNGKVLKKKETIAKTKKALAEAKLLNSENNTKAKRLFAKNGYKSA